MALRLNPATGEWYDPTVRPTDLHRRPQAESLEDLYAGLAYDPYGSYEDYGSVTQPGQNATAPTSTTASTATGTPTPTAASTAASTASASEVMRERLRAARARRTAAGGTTSTRTASAASAAAKPGDRARNILKERLRGAVGSSSTAKVKKPKGKLFREGGAFSSKKLKGFYDKASSPEIDYDKKSGISAYGKNLGKYLTIANTLYQGYNAAKGLQSNADARREGEDIMSNIISASYSNPNVQYDLSPEQLALLRDLRRGDYEPETSLTDIDLGGALGGALGGVLTGAAGGVPGMVIGGLGGALNSVIGDFGSEQSSSNAELEALYQAILESDRHYNDLKRQRAYANLGTY